MTEKKADETKIKIKLTRVLKLIFELVHMWNLDFRYFFVTVKLPKLSTVNNFKHLDKNYYFSNLIGYPRFIRWNLECNIRWTVNKNNFSLCRKFMSDGEFINY